MQKRARTASRHLRRRDDRIVIEPAAPPPSPSTDNHPARAWQVPERQTEHRAISFVRRGGIYVALVAVLVIASIASPKFLTASNFISILEAISIVGVIAVGQTFVAVGGGLADLSVGSVVGLAAVLGLGLQRQIPPPLAVAAALAAGLAVGAINGVLIGGFRTNSIVTTIGSGVVISGLGLWYTQGNTMFAQSSEFQSLGTGTVVGIPSLVIAFVVIAAIGYVGLTRTVSGRRLYATGGNYEAARVSGVRVKRVVALAFVLTALTSATAGIMLAALLGQVNYDSGDPFTFNSIAAVAVGGTSLFGGEGGVPRTVAGALLIGVLNNFVVVIGLPLEFQVVVTGAVILLAIATDVWARGMFQR